MFTKIRDKFNQLFKRKSSEIDPETTLMIVEAERFEKVRKVTHLEKYVAYLEDILRSKKVHFLSSPFQDEFDIGNSKKDLVEYAIEMIKLQSKEATTKELSKKKLPSKLRDLVKLVTMFLAGMGFVKVDWLKMLEQILNSI